jgi:hypothetical protein
MRFTLPQFRLAVAVFVFVMLQIASGLAVIGQDNDWSPYRDQDRSKERIERQVQAKQIRFPPPVRLKSSRPESVRLAQHAEDPAPLTDPAEAFDEMALDSPSMTDSRAASHPWLTPRTESAFAPSSPAHVVIRSPAQQTTRAPATGRQASHASLGVNHFSDSNQEHLPAPPLHGQHSKLAKQKWIHGPVQPRQATIPDARERAAWKQPYSYGYFGASSSRHWGTHHGYRDRYTEYRYR